MELSHSQIESLFEFTENNGVHYYDVQVELVDHLAAKIEDDMETNGTLTFPEALNRAYDSFGRNGFKNVLREKKWFVIDERNKVLLDEVKQWFTFQRLTLILTVALTIYFLWTAFGPFVPMWIVWAGSLIFYIYGMKTMLKYRITKKILLLKDKTFGKIFCTVNTYPIFLGPLPLITDAFGPDALGPLSLAIDFSRHVGVMVNIVLVLFVLQVITFNIEMRLRRQIKTLYPEAYAPRS